MTRHLADLASGRGAGHLAASAPSARPPRRSGRRSCTASAAGGYVYFTGSERGHDDDAHRRIYVLKADGADPMTARWTACGALVTDHPGIDPTVFTLGGRLYFMYSAYVGDESRLVIAAMRDPVTLSGPQVEIGRPTRPWEMFGGRKILEGPEFLQGPHWSAVRQLLRQRVLGGRVRAGPALGPGWRRPDGPEELDQVAGGWSSACPRRWASMRLVTTPSSSRRTAARTGSSTMPTRGRGYRCDRRRSPPRPTLRLDRRRRARSGRSRACRRAAVRPIWRDGRLAVKGAVLAVDWGHDPHARPGSWTRRAMPDHDVTSRLGWPRSSPGRRRSASGTTFAPPWPRRICPPSFAA